VAAGKGKKTAKKSAKTQKPSGRNGNVLPAGNHPGNTGGKKGRSGRLPDATKEWLRQAGTDDKARKAFVAKLRDGDVAAWKTLLTYTEKLPAQTLDVNLTDSERVKRLKEILSEAEGR
jgi:hypothetical protein